jgi:hypothetical protein
MMTLGYSSSALARNSPRPVEKLRGISRLRHTRLGAPDQVSNGFLRPHLDTGGRGIHVPTLIVAKRDERIDATRPCGR